MSAFTNMLTSTQRRFYRLARAAGYHFHIDELGRKVWVNAHNTQEYITMDEYGYVTLCYYHHYNDDVTLNKNPWGHISTVGVSDLLVYLN